MTPIAFKFVLDALATQDPEFFSDSRLGAALYMGSHSAPIDLGGNLRIPAETADRVGLDDGAEVVIAGAIERLEIWPAAVWSEAMEAQEERLDLLFDLGVDLGTADAPSAETERHR